MAPLGKSVLLWGDMEARCNSGKGPTVTRVGNRNSRFLAPDGNSPTREKRDATGAIIPDVVDLAIPEQRNSSGFNIENARLPRCKVFDGGIDLFTNEDSQYRHPRRQFY